MTASTPVQEVCAVLMATKGRLDSLQHVSLPSVRKQSQPPVLVLLVTDGCEIPPTLASELKELVGGEFMLITNRRAAGAAGAWNTGLDFLAARNFDGFVAMLDDDDEWSENHLVANLRSARDANASVVVSGLRLLKDGVQVERTLPRALIDRMFLTGNPGWQGSNTFASMQAMKAVGGFRDGMPSANDRDLAIRLLRRPSVRIAYTGEWTATWHLSSQRGSLSSPRSEAKRRGLRWFWQIYGSEMQPIEIEQFFARAASLFQIEREEILSKANDYPPHREPRGDFL
ncbi:MAG: glycosyltransferase family 2 protein [Verrucomicrobia bacterium]|nr:glycosyltransferase family 2 protein [Verrucomicrobiota bacterium]